MCAYETFVYTSKITCHQKKMADPLRKGSVVKHLVVPRARGGRRNLTRRSCPQSVLLAHLSQVTVSHSDHLPFDTDKPRNHLRLNSHFNLSRICLLQKDGQERGQSLSPCDKGAQGGGCCQLPRKSLWRGNWWQTSNHSRSCFSCQHLHQGNHKWICISISHHCARAAWPQDPDIYRRRRKLNPPHANHHCCCLLLKFELAN